MSVHAWVVQLPAALAAPLGCIHRGVSVTLQVPGGDRLPCARYDDANARARCEVASVDSQRRAKLRQDTGRHVGGLVGIVQVFQQDRELVAAKAGRSVARPQTGAQSTGYLD